MHCTRQISSDLYYIGVNNISQEYFENVYPTPQGMAYNSYLLLDTKTVLLDTVDKTVGAQFLDNLAFVLQDRKLDYLVIHHIEPDHGALIKNVLQEYPEVTLVGNAKTLMMLHQFFDFKIEVKTLVVKENDVLETGKHQLKFMMAPMVHWPEVMVTFDLVDKILFSADAFGTFGSLNGNIYADEIDFKSEWQMEARRYYSNVIGKYGPQVRSLLQKISNLNIALLCPLHGPLWRKDIALYLALYQKWANYTPEEKGIVIVFGSVYGNTEQVAMMLAHRLAALGVKNIHLYDVSKTHFSYIIATMFRFSHIVLASTTYNMGIFVNMEHLVHIIVHHNLQKRTFALIENGSWAPVAANLIRLELQKLKDVDIFKSQLTIKSSLKDDQLAELEALAQQLSLSILA